MNKPLVVAEIGINHNGSVEMACAHVDIASTLGVDYIKFQKRTIDAVYDPKYLAEPRESPWGTTQREQKEALEFNHAEYGRIARYCAGASAQWFATPMDSESLDFLMRFDPPFVKIASMDITNLALLDAARGCGRPVVLSTGMSTEAQVSAAVDILGSSCQYLLHCVAAYPTADEDVNLRRMLSLKRLYGTKCRVGFSSHSAEPLMCFAAACLGAEMLEFHLSLNRRIYGSDQGASLDPPRAEWLMNALRSYDVALGRGDMDPRPSEAPARKKLRRFP